MHADGRDAQQLPPTGRRRHTRPRTADTLGPHAPRPIPRTASTLTSALADVGHRAGTAKGTAGAGWSLKVVYPAGAVRDGAQLTPSQTAGAPRVTVAGPGCARGAARHEGTSAVQVIWRAAAGRSAPPIRPPHCSGQHPGEGGRRAAAQAARRPAAARTLVHRRLRARRRRDRGR